MTNGEQERPFLLKCVGFFKRRRALIVPCIVLLIPFLIVGLFFWFASWSSPGSADGAVDTGRKVVDFLAALPTKPGAYYFLALLLGLVAAWRCVEYFALMANGIRSVDREGRSELQVQIAHMQRRRAFGLRAGASFILSGVLLLLAGGLYFVVFVLPAVVGDYDPQVELQSEVRKRYGASFDDLVNGRFWLSVPREGRLSSSNRQNQLLFFSEDGTLGVASPGSSDEERGSVLVSTDRGRTWRRRPGMELASEDTLQSAVFLGPYILALSQRGAAYTTTRGADSWRTRSHVPINENELVADAWWRKMENGEDSVLVLGRWSTFEASQTQVLADSWQTPTWSPEWMREKMENDEIIYARFNHDGSTGVVARQSGKVHVLTKDSKWHDMDDLVPPYRPLGWYGRPVAASFSADGELGVLGGPFHFLVITKDGAKSWDEPKGEGLMEVRGWAAAALAQNASNGVLLGVEGSVFVTDDRGSSWSRRNSLELEVGEMLTGGFTVAFSTNAMQGIAVGSKGSVFVTNDGGNSWHLTAGVDRASPLRAVAMVASEVGLDALDSAVGIDSAGRFHLLRRHIELAEWRSWSTSELLTQLRASRVRRDSRFIEKFDGFLSGQTSDSGARGIGAVNGGFGSIVNPLLFLRIFALTIMFFVVALLVRLYQYNIRLAAFWESRSDAVMLSGENLAGSSKSFSELVDALSPDSHDFKKGPRAITQGVAEIRSKENKDS